MDEEIERSIHVNGRMSLELQFDDKPAEKGSYLVYADYPGIKTDKLTHRFLLNWDGEYWWYSLSDQQFRSPVWAFFGPLPNITLSE